MNALTKFFVVLAGAAISGVMMILLFPPFSASWLVWLMLMPVLAALWSLGPKRRKRKAFLTGWLMGSVGFLGIFSWLTTVTSLGWVAVSIYLGLFPAVWAIFAASLANPDRDARGNQWSGSILRAFWIAAMWCGTEWLRGWLFTGFGWNGLGVAFHQTPVFAQSADLFGVTGLSFLPVFVQVVGLQVVLRLMRKSAEEIRKPLYDLAVAVCLVAAAVGYGRWRVSLYNKGESVRLRALMVQLNVPQEGHDVGMSWPEIHMAYEDETTAAIHNLPTGKRPDWVIWPESALEGQIVRMPDGTAVMSMENRESLDRVAEEGSFTSIMGLLESEGEPLGDQIVRKKDGQVWNSMAVFPAQGDLQTFRKHHLVIFGEWIPFIEHLDFLKKIYKQQSGEDFPGSLSRGESLEPLKLQVGSNEVQAIPTVCFEDSVGRLVRLFARKDVPQVIVNVTNDGWFKESIGAEQHFANSRFRAIELRRPLVRCANSGVTAAVDTLGLTRNPDTGKPQEIRDATGKTFLRGHLLADVNVPKHPQWTLYTAIGDWGVIVLAAGSWVWALFFSRRNRPAEPEMKESFG